MVLKHTEKELRNIATQLRMDIIEEVHAAASGHPGGSLSIADCLAILYFEEMRIDPAHPEDPDRDRFVLSKGHAAPALYAALARRGYFSPDLLPTLRKFGSPLQGHPSYGHLAGIDMTSGSLGQGISAAVGMALAAKMTGKDYRTYVIVGDGESEEGQVWEAAMMAGHRKLDNLCVMIDWNGLQIDGEVAEVAGPAPFEAKFRDFGFHTISIDGHNQKEIIAALDEARATKEMPTAIIMKTVKGKGVSFMENQVSWHGNAPKDPQYLQAMEELKAQIEA